MALVKEFEALNKVLLNDEEIAKVKDCEMYDDIKEGELDCSNCSGNCRFIAKAQLKKVVEDLRTYAFAEPQSVPASGRELIAVCIPVSDWQSLLEEVK